MAAVEQMTDPLGAPRIVTGAEYMDALSRLGYNVDTMNSMLPTYTKAANAATSLMDQAFNQRLEWDKAQAANKEAIAHANDYQAEADFTNRSSDQRIEAQRLKNQEDLLSLDYNQYIQAGRKKEFDLQQQQLQQNADIANATFEGRKALVTEQGKYALADTQQKTQDLQSALADRQPALDELNQIPKDAPDFDQQIADWHRRHLTALNNPATAGQIGSELKNVMDQRSQLISVQRTAANRKELSRLAEGNHLPANMDLDSAAFINNPQKVQQALVQGHVSEEVDNLNGLYTSITASGIKLPPELQRQWEDLRGVRDRLVKTQNLDGYTDLINGGNGNGDILNPDGHLRKDVAVLEQNIQAYLQQQAAVKAPTMDIVTGKPLSTGPEFTIKGVPLGQAQQYGYGVPGAGALQKQEEALKLGANPQFVKDHPEIMPFVRAWNQNQNDANKAALADAILKAAGGKGYQYGGRVGYQSGGQVGYGAGSAGDPATTAAPSFLSSTNTGFLGDQPQSTGTTDTVPAMLTPGEFVLNKNAVTAIGPGNLAAMNKIGGNLNLVPAPATGTPNMATVSENPLTTNPLAGTDAAVAAFEGLSQQQQRAQEQLPQKITPESDTASQTTQSVNQPVAVQQAISNAGRLPTSNVNNYAYPEGAPDVNGIDRNVWANVMGEEGPEFGMDGKHMSVFGLWKDAPGAEGQAFSTIRQYGANSLQAYNAVTGAWNKLFLGQTKPQLLKSPGMQEMVIADSQHVGGKPTLELINQMGGWDAINKMNPADAIRQYSALRTKLWPGNEARVNRERQWALANDGTLSGQGGQQVAGMQAGGMVNPAAYNPQMAVQPLAGLTGGMPTDPLQPMYDPSMIMPAAPQPDLTQTGQVFPPPNRPVYTMQDGGYVPQPGTNFQQGGEVSGAGSAGGFESELDQPGGGGAEGQRHRRFHPRTAATAGGGFGAQPNIPDPMQKKVAKLSQDFIGGLSSLIRSRPELGGAIVQHAKNLMASTGLSDVRTEGGGGSSDFLGGPRREQQPMMMNPAMMAMGGGEGSSSEEAYT